MERGEDIVALFVGDTTKSNRDYLSTLHNKIESSAHKNRFFFAGHQSDVEPYILASDIIVNASVKFEGFGRSIVEAQKLAIPVISTDIGGPSESIEHKKNGVLIQPLYKGTLSRFILE